MTRAALDKVAVANKVEAMSCLVEKCILLFFVVSDGNERHEGAFYVICGLAVPLWPKTLRASDFTQYACGGHSPAPAPVNFRYQNNELVNYISSSSVVEFSRGFRATLVSFVFDAFFRQRRIIVVNLVLDLALLRALCVCMLYNFWSRDLRPWYPPPRTPGMTPLPVSHVTNYVLFISKSQLSYFVNSRMENYNMKETKSESLMQQK